MADAQSIETATNLLEFFRDELTLAMRETGVNTTEETEAYLVHLLDSYSRMSPASAEELGFDKPAAHLLEEAMESVGDRRIEIYRRLGDASLYNCGFFAERLERHVGPRYYSQLGRTAYSSLSDMMTFKQPGGIFDVIYRELCAKFDAVVEAFRWLSGKSRRSAVDRLVDSWSGETDGNLLLRSGVLAAKDSGEA